MMQWISILRTAAASLALLSPMSAAPGEPAVPNHMTCAAIQGDRGALDASQQLPAALAFSDQRMTRDPGATCAFPKVADYFLLTDEAAYIWFIVTDAAAGDAGRDDWYDPQGKLVKQAAWQPLAKAGSFCMWARFAIAGAVGAGQTGTWEVRVAWNGAQKLSLRFSILERPPGGIPFITPKGIVNSADFTSALSPGALYSLFGDNLAGSTLKAETAVLPTSLGGTSVEILDGDSVVASPLLFASKQQVNGQVPYGLKSAQVRIRVRNPSGVSLEQTVPIQAQSPRLYTAKMDGKGDAIVLHTDYTAVSKQARLKPGETGILYGTGFGDVTPAQASGSPAGDGTPGNPVRNVKSVVELDVGGKPAQVAFAGLAPGFVGLYQVNFAMPGKVDTSTPSLVTRSGQASSPPASFTWAYVGEPGSPGSIVLPMWDHPKYERDIYWVFLLENVDVYCRDLNGEVYRCGGSINLDNNLGLVPLIQPGADTLVECCQVATKERAGTTIEVVHRGAPCISGLCREVRKSVRTSESGVEKEVSYGFTFVQTKVTNWLPGQFIFTREGPDLGSYVTDIVFLSKRKTPQESSTGQFERIEFRSDSRLTVIANHEDF